MPGWATGGATIQRGPYRQGIYLPAQPQVGVQAGMPPVQRGTDSTAGATLAPGEFVPPAPAPGDPVADYRAAALAAARAPFQVPGGQEYNYGYLTDQRSSWDAARPAREAEALAGVADLANKRGEVAARQRAAEAQMEQVANERRQTEHVINQGASSPQQVAAKGQADVLQRVIGMAPGAVGPDGTLPPLEEFLKAFERQGRGPVQPGTEDYSALMGSQYGPELEARLEGKPYGLVETPIFGHPFPNMYRYQALRDLARRNVGVRPGQSTRPGLRARPASAPAMGLGGFLTSPSRGRELFPTGY
jgi:hypothetical protein